VNHGIVVVFAAGNNHADVLCNHPVAACGPNTIWAVNSVDEVIAVGAVNAGEAHPYSRPGSRRNYVDLTAPAAGASMCRRGSDRLPGRGGKRAYLMRIGEA
jgi:hypothetical protein